MSKELLTHLWLWRQEIWLPMTLTAQTLKGCGTEQLRASEVAIYRQHCRQADEVDQVIDKHGVSKKLKMSNNKFYNIILQPKNRYTYLFVLINIYGLVNKNI